MSLADCITEVIEASGGILTKDEAKSLLETYKDVTDKLSLEDRYATLAAILEKTHQMEIDGQQVSLLRERYTRTRLAMNRQRLDTHFEGVARQGSNPVYKALIAKMTEAESIVESMRGEPAYWFATALSKGDYQGITAIKDPVMFSAAVDLFFEPKSSRSYEGVRPEVKSLVESMDSMTDWIYAHANKSGGYLNWRPSILFSTRAATSERLGAISKDAFVDFMVDRMDDNVDTLYKHGIFKHDDLVKRLETVYDLMRDGKHYQTNGGYDDAGSGPMIKATYGQTVNRVSDSVFDLPFKDGGAYRDFFQFTNGGDMADHLFAQINQVGRNLGMVQAFDVVPELGLKAMKDAARAAADSDAEKALIDGKFVEGHLGGEVNPKFEGLGRAAVVPDTIAKGLLVAKSWLTEPSLDHWYKTLSGESGRIHDQRGAEIGRAARGFVSIGKLIGTGHLTQWGDLPNTLAILSRLDDNPTAAVQKTLEAYWNSYDPNIKWDVDARRSLGNAMDVQHGLAADIYYGGDYNPTSRTRPNVFDKLFKYTLMHRLDWVRISTINHYIDSRMSGWLEGAFEDLTPEVSQILSRGGLTAEDWGALKEGYVVKLPQTGEPHFLPENVSDHAVRSKYLRMQREVNRIAVPRPGAREAALINRGTNPGTVEGELFRTIGLFKSFGIAMATRVLPFIASLPLKDKLVWGTGMALTYMIRDSIKQLSLGRSPKDYRDPKNWGEVLIYSGMGGVYGDMVGQDMSKYGAAGGVAGAFAGPVLSSSLQTGADLFHTYTSGQTTEKKIGKTAEAGVRAIGLDKVPLVTPALNKMVLYSFYEAMEPGWMQRHLGGLKSRGQKELY